LKGKGKKRLTAARVPTGFLARSGQREVNGELLVVSGIDGAVEELRLGKEISCAWSSGSFASRSSSKGRLESPWLRKASAVLPWVDLQSNWTNGWH
jgi:hypothetical protein